MRRRYTIIIIDGSERPVEWSTETGRFDDPAKRTGVVDDLRYVLGQAIKRQTRSLIDGAAGDGKE